MENIYVIGHKNPDTDSIVAAIAYANFKNKIESEDEYIPVRAGEINSETKYVLERFKIPVPELMTDTSGRKIILVDHNEMGQVVRGTEKARIFEIIDHHKIGDIQTSAPIMFHAEPIGSTATIIADFYFYHKVKLSKSMASILLAAILSDTVIFKSPTTTEKDKLIAEKLNKIAGLDVESFGMEVKKAKSSIKGRNANELIMSDFKDLEKNGYKYGIGQIEVVHYEEAVARKVEILKELSAVGASRGQRLIILMVTNIIEEATKLWFIGDAELINKAFKKKSENNELFLPGVMSRKKQVVPLIHGVI